jgi:DNA-binding beta-propeller fold protein YncE
VGKTFGALGIIDLGTNKIISEIPLSGYPKQFEIDSDRIYINIPSKNIIDVVDRKTGKVSESWPVTSGSENVPMGFDRIHKRLFIACNSGEFLVFSSETGKVIDSLKIGKEADGIYYDASRKQIYVSCGEGFIEVIKQIDADHYQSIDRTTTIEGAGTSLFSPKLNKFILAIPQTKNNVAQLRVYEPIN